MTVAPLKIAALLVSRGLSTGDALETAEQIMEIIEAYPADSVSLGLQRERWRLKKQRQRARRAIVPGDKTPPPISSKDTQKVEGKRKKERPSVSVSPLSPGDNPRVADDWPEDYLEQFWRLYPPFRKTGKAVVAKKLAKIRADGQVSWSRIIDGLRRYVISKPGEFARGPVVWINNGDWDAEYGERTNGTSQGTSTSGKGGFAGVAAKLRAAKDSEPSDQGPSAGG